MGKELYFYHITIEMEKINAILVDDEESARSILNNLLQRYCPNVVVQSTFENVEEAVEGIKKLQPQIVFLDIEMPNYAGYEIINFFENIDFEIIFITAYDKYAVRAFEVSAVDYLLKPIDIDKLKRSIERAGEKIKLKQKVNSYQVLSETLQSKELDTIVISEKGYQIKIKTKDIIAIEAQESYSLIYTTNEKHFVSKNLKYFEKFLFDTNRFYRVHKSWIINKDHLIGYSKSKLEIKLTNNISSRLSKYRKTDFEDFIS